MVVLPVCAAVFRFSATARQACIVLAEQRLRLALSLALLRYFRISATLRFPSTARHRGLL